MLSQSANHAGLEDAICSKTHVAPLCRVCVLPLHQQDIVAQQEVDPLAQHQNNRCDELANRILYL